MGKYSGLLICSDFDGTLFYKNGVSQENLEAIRAFREQGGAFTLATGRYPSSILARMGAEFLSPTPVICMNGGILYDVAEEKELFCGEMPDGFRQTVLDAMGWKGIKDVRLFPNREWEFIHFLPDETDALQKAWNQPLIKVEFHIEDEVSDCFKADLIRCLGDAFTVERSWHNGIEIYGASYGKGITARKLAKRIGADKLICVGDYENDLSMIREADLGVAVGNALPSVKEAADLVVASAKDSGIARLIESL